MSILINIFCDYEEEFDAESESCDNNFIASESIEDFDLDYEIANRNWFSDGDSHYCASCWKEIQKEKGVNDGR